MITGDDYGVCCAAVDKLVKPGSCPVDAQTLTLQDENTVAGTEDEDDVVDMRCGATCQHDLQCPSTQKCCMSDICGQHCVQPVNLTSELYYYCY